jgi:hypothetical protein
LLNIHLCLEETDFEQKSKEEFSGLERKCGGGEDKNKK